MRIKFRWLVLFILIIIFSGFIFTKVRAGKQTIITQYSDISGSQAMFYIIKTKEGKVIVVDGGTSGNSDYVRDELKKIGEHVSSWILTHPHPDHIGAFNEIYADPQEIEIDDIITIDMDYELYKGLAKEWDDFSTYERFVNLTKSADNIQIVHSDDEFDLYGLKVKVFNAYDENTIKLSEDIPNEGSMVFKISSKNNSMLFCADIYGDVLCDKIIEKYGNELKAEYVQMGHHGNHSITKKFVEMVQPSVAFFDAPDWLVEGENYDAKDNIKMVEDMGITAYTYLTCPNSVTLE